MKYIIFLITILFCFSCDMYNYEYNYGIVNTQWFDSFALNTTDNIFFDSDLTTDEIGRYQQVANFLGLNITYKTDQDNYGKQDYYASPEECYNKKSGDCEDIAILAIAIMNKKYNEQGMLLELKENHDVAIFTNYVIDHKKVETLAYFLNSNNFIIDKIIPYRFIQTYAQDANKYLDETLNNTH
jgi:predicted transglutaminase-like protease